MEDDSLAGIARKPRGPQAVPARASTRDLHWSRAREATVPGPGYMLRSGPANIHMESAASWTSCRR